MDSQLLILLQSSVVFIPNPNVPTNPSSNVRFNKTPFGVLRVKVIPPHPSPHESYILNCVPSLRQEEPIPPS